jgi:hypothetical protein
MAQTRLEQQLLAALRAELVVVRAVASLPIDKIATTAAIAIKANRKSFARRVIWISWPDYPIFHSSIIIRRNRIGGNRGDRGTKPVVPGIVDSASARTDPGRIRVGVGALLGDAFALFCGHVH